MDQPLRSAWPEFLSTCQKKGLEMARIGNECGAYQLQCAILAVQPCSCNLGRGGRFLAEVSPPRATASPCGPKSFGPEAAMFFNFPYFNLETRFVSRESTHGCPSESAVPFWQKNQHAGYETVMRGSRINNPECEVVSVLCCPWQGTKLPEGAQLSPAQFPVKMKGECESSMFA